MREFFFGTRKPIFSDMHGFRFLSEDYRETATIEFIYFIFISF